MQQKEFNSKLKTLLNTKKSKNMETNNSNTDTKSKAIEWWEKTIYDTAERVEWKMKLSSKYYGGWGYTNLTDEEIVHIYLSEQPQPLKEDTINSNEMDSWIKQLEPIILEYRGEGEDEEPLDGDAVDRLCEIIKAKINLHEGNITESEYEKILG